MQSKRDRATDLFERTTHPRERKKTIKTMSLFADNSWFWALVLVGAMSLAARSIVRRIQHARAKRQQGHGSKRVSSTHVSNSSNEKRRADGTLASATLTFGNGNVYAGELNAEHLFDGVGAYQYKLTQGQLLQYTPAQLAARRKAILLAFETHRVRHKPTADKLDRLFRKPLWRSSLDQLSLNDSVPFVGYAGEFKDGFQHGVGREFTHNDQAYEGEFVDGKRHGFAVQVFAAGAQGIYVGQFVNDKKHDDAGTFFFGPNIDGPMVLPQNALNGAVFVGPFRDGKRHGRGVLRRPNGDEVEMTFHEGVVQSAIPKDKNA
jgi:hypothetical protein